jgi:NAD(P)-dependent dehydrogenase (short-subunit alcohol dehydrogenase family)
MSRHPSFTKAYHQTPSADISPSNPVLSAAGKVIVITGGGGGIGKAIAAAFIEAEASAIVLIGRTEATLKETKEELSTNTKSSISYFLADTTDPVTVEKAFSTAVKLYGKIDVLVNNAGYLDAHKTLAESALDDYWRCFEINTKGPIVTTQAFLKVAHPGATLINVTSGAAIIPHIPGYSSYSSSKLGAAKVMEYVHHENPDLRVFNLQPGTVQTDMAKKSDLNVRTFDEPSMSHGIRSM